MTAAEIHSEVMLFLEQANYDPEKQVGRTSDKGIIPAISNRIVPIHFHKGVNRLEGVMLHAEGRLSATTFVVTVQVIIIGGEIQGYIVLEVHGSFPR